MFNPQASNNMFNPTANVFNPGASTSFQFQQNKFAPTQSQNQYQSLQEYLDTKFKIPLSVSLDP